MIVNDRMRGNIIIKKVMSFLFERTPYISLSSKLVPVQYREYGLLIYKDVTRIRKVT